MTQTLECAAALKRGTVRIQCGPLSIQAEEQSVEEVQFIYHELFEKKIYLKHGIVLPSGSTILDIGANIGLFSLFALQHSPGCRLLSFEPVPNNFRLLQANLEGRSEQGVVHLSQSAVSNAVGKRKVTYFPYMPGNSTLAPEQKLQEMGEFYEHYDLRDAWSWSPWAFTGLLLAYPFRKRLLRHFGMQRFAAAQTFSCSTVTLDEIFRTRELQEVQLLKIDAEGEELAILDGLSDQNLARVRQLVFESPVLNRPRLPILEKRLRRSGFASIFVDNPRQGKERQGSAWPDLVYALR